MRVIGNKLEPDELCWQLIDSIETIDIRISELKMFINKLSEKSIHKKDLLERIERLIHTRFNLVYVFIDTLGVNKRSIFGEMQPTYQQLKREIKQ